MITAILLAAGAGRRFGRQKLLICVGGRPLVWHAASRLLNEPVDDVVVVVGAEGAAVTEALEGLPVRIVDVRDGEGAMSASLRTGILALQTTAEAVVVALGDQPGVPPGIVARTIAVWRRQRISIVVPVYDGVQGHPVLFDLNLRDELLAVDGDRGARALVARDAARVHRLPVVGQAPRDVDTEADVALAEAEIVPIVTGER